MKHILLNLFLFMFSFFSCAGQQQKTSAITCCSWYGRLGDRLLLYINARWLAYHFKVPFFYKPFKYSDEFLMHTKELHLPENYKKIFNKIIKTKTIPKINSQNGILYEIDYYIKDSIGSLFKLIEDKNFLTLIKSMIAPANPIPIIPLPKNKHCVAVHVRKGGGYDLPLYSQQIYRSNRAKFYKFNDSYFKVALYQDKAHPLKFPPEQYYIDQILRLYKMLNNEPMYIYIFTDDQDPIGLVERLEKKLVKKNIEFGCRQESNHHAKNVVEDLFGITQFDYFIRGGSHFALIADVIGNYKVVISPVNYKWEGNKLIITQVHIKKNSP